MKTTNEVAISHGIVLTQDNSKKFATRLRKTLKENSIDFKTSKCYDILAKTFGSSNWHELSQHLQSQELTNINAEKKTPQKDNNENTKLNSIFDLPWVEFKYVVSKIATNLDFDFHTKEFLDILLDIVHENQPRSEIYWEKLDEFLDSPEKNFRTDLDHIPIYDYTVILNPTLTQLQQENYIKKVAKSGHLNGYYRIRFSPEKIETFFNMLRFLKNENFVLRDVNTNFAVSEVLQFSNNEYFSDYPFINMLIRLADINNDYIEYNKNYDKKLTFHDLIIHMYSRTSLLNHVRRQHELTYEVKNFTTEIFTNNEFISYLLSHFKVYVKNYFTLKLEQTKMDFGPTYPDGVTENINVIEYNLEYVPHGLIFKAMLEKIDVLNFVPKIVNNTNQETVLNNFKIIINLKANAKSILVQEFKHANYIDYLKDKSFQPHYKDSTVYYIY